MISRRLLNLGRSVRPAVLVAALVLTAGWATAQRPILDAETARLLVEALGSEDFDDREAAQASLRSLPTRPEEIAEALPDDIELSMEQWARLDAALFDRYLAIPRAGLGVQMRPIENGVGIELVRVVEQFPAAAVLKEGDVVIATDGRALPAEPSAALRAAILSHDAGGTMDLTIRRNGRTMMIKCPLGSYDDLNAGAASRLSVDLLMEAWDLRRERLGLTPPDAALDPLNAIGERTDRDTFLLDRRRSGPRVLAGGQPATSVGNATAAQRVVDGDRRQVGRITITTRGRGGALPVQLLRPPVGLTGERVLQALQDQANQLIGEINRYERQLRDETLDRRARQAIEAQLRKARQSLSEVRAKATEIQRGN
jgi:hypothetical protein